MTYAEDDIHKSTCLDSMHEHLGSVWTRVTSPVAGSTKPYQRALHWQWGKATSLLACRLSASPKAPTQWKVYSSLLGLIIHPLRTGSQYFSTALCLIENTFLSSAYCCVGSKSFGLSVFILGIRVFHCGRGKDKQWPSIGTLSSGHQVLLQLNSGRFLSCISFLSRFRSGSIFLLFKVWGVWQPL